MSLAKGSGLRFVPFLAKGMAVVYLFSSLAKHGRLVKGGNMERCVSGVLRVHRIFGYWIADILIRRCNHFLGGLTVEANTNN